ncbi:MAG: hypothetical protein V2G33_03750 [bacterium JZ-2024 1]
MVKRAEGFYFDYAGINVEAKGNWKEALNQLRNAGFSAVRIVILRSEIEKGKRDYTWQPVEEVVEHARSLGMKIFGVIEGRTGKVEENAQKEIALFASAVASRFRGRIGYYEISEQFSLAPVIPGMGKPASIADTYAQVFRLAYYGIRAQDPNAKVLIGATGLDDRTVIEGLARNGTFALADGFSALIFPSPFTGVNYEYYSNLRRDVEYIRTYLGPKKLLIAGRVQWTGGFPTPADRGIAWLQMAVLLPYLSFDFFFFAPLWDSQEGKADGFFSGDGKPAESVFFLSTAFSYLSQKHPTPPPFSYQLQYHLSPMSVPMGFSYQNGGEGVLVFWQEGVKSSGVLLLSQSSFYPVAISDPRGILLGEIQFQKIVNGWMLSPLPPSPVPLFLFYRAEELDQIFPESQPH